MDDYTRKLLKDGIAARRVRLGERLRNVFRVKLELLSGYPMGQLIKEVQIEIELIEKDLFELDKTEKEINETE